MNGPTKRLAAKREQEWIEKHGRHDYAGRDLRREAMEELADTYNYLQDDPDLAEMVVKIGDELYRRMEASMNDNEELLREGECPQPNCIEAAGHAGLHSSEHHCSRCTLPAVSRVLWSYSSCYACRKHAERIGADGGCRRIEYFEEAS